MRVLPVILLLFFLGETTYGQTQFWSDTFEDAGAPSAGSRVASVEFTCGAPATAYFVRAAPSGLALQNGPYSNFQGSKVWAAEDIDKGPTCTNNSISANQTVTWSGINIVGKAGISFKGLFAANNINGAYQGLQWGAAQDKIEVEYQIDGGGWQKVIGFYSNDGTTTASSNVFSRDTNGDFIGDGTALTYTFGEFSATITGSGNTLDLRLNIFANAATAQEVAVDNFRLFSSTVLPVKLVSFGGIANPGANKLEWVSEEEINSSYYEIERSTDGIQFEKIGLVSGKGNSSSQQKYSYVDQNDVPALTYYRLKQVDVNGSFTYSAVVIIRRAEALSVHVYPNPVTNRLFVEMKNMNSNNIKSLQLMDVAGRMFPLKANYTVNGFVLDTDGLHAGVYFLQWNKEGAVYRTMVIKK